MVSLLCWRWISAFSLSNFCADLFLFSPSRNQPCPSREQDVPADSLPSTLRYSLEPNSPPSCEQDGHTDLLVPTQRHTLERDTSPLRGRDDFANSLPSSPLHAPEAEVLVEHRLISIKDKAVLVAWDHNDSTEPTRYLYERGNSSSREVLFSVMCNHDSQTASFKLQMTIDLSTRRSALHKRTPFFIYIHPETITTLTHQAINNAPARVYDKFGPDAAVSCLKFRLTKHPDLIVPKDIVIAKQCKGRENIKALQDLASRTALAVYVQRTDLPDMYARVISQTVTSPEIRSAFKAHDLNRLHGGKGARIWLPSGDLLPSLEPASAPASPPPAYPDSHSDSSAPPENGKPAPSLYVSWC